MAADLKDMLPFLSEDSRPEVKHIAAQYILGLTAAPEGLQLLGDNDIIKHLTKCLQVEVKTEIGKKICDAVINLSSDDNVASKIVSEDETFVPFLIGCTVDSSFEMSERASMLLANITRQPDLCRVVFESIQATSQKLDGLVSVLGQGKSVPQHIGSILANLTQMHEARQYILDKDKGLILKLLPVIRLSDSEINRRAVAASIRNCCFETGYHEWLLGEDVDILPALLLPLAGPEEFTDEEMDKLPLDLQYLGEDKLREPNPEVRCLLLEALTQLCSTRKCREVMREKNVYVILRELHKWDRDSSTLTACENLVDILIRTEDEIGHDNLKDLNIPDDVTKKLESLTTQ